MAVDDLESDLSTFQLVEVLAFCQKGNDKFWIVNWVSFGNFFFKKIPKHGSKVLRREGQSSTIAIILTNFTQIHLLPF